MIGNIANAMRLQALRAGSSKISSRLGIITGYDPSKYAVKVSIQPEGIATGFIPLAAQWCGNGWGMFAPPSINDPCSVIFVDGDFTAGYAECVFFNASLVPPSVPSGEFWLLHASGQSVKLTNNGKLAVSDGHGATVTLNGDGSITSAASSWAHTGNITVTGTLTASTDVVGGGKSLKTHVHTGVTTGGGDSGPPL